MNNGIAITTTLSAATTKNVVRQNLSSVLVATPKKPTAPQASATRWSQGIAAHYCTSHVEPLED
jgi:hypothetical protein